LYKTLERQAITGWRQINFALFPAPLRLCV
jgi:hypothetical protein